MFRVAIVTASDAGAAGKREDQSGALIRELMEKQGWEVVSQKILPDERAQIAQELRRLCDQGLADLVLTTGGTGLSPRDFTPEATLDVAQRLVPGISEAMRYSSLKITPRAMLSRGVSVIRGQTLIINLPGSPRAVRENLESILPALGHGLEILTDRAHECASER